MLNDCQKGKISDLEVHLEDAIRTLKEDKFEDKFNDDDLKYHQLIHSGRNSEIESLVSVMQAAIKKKGGMIAAFCN